MWFLSFLIEKIWRTSISLKGIGFLSIHLLNIKTESYELVGRGKGQESQSPVIISLLIIICSFFFSLSPSRPPLLSSFQELRGIKLRLRWFNANNFVKFFCVSVDHLQFQKRTNKETERKETKKTKKKRRRSSVTQRRGKVRLKQRVLYKTIRWLAKVITSCFPCQRRMITACRFLIIYLILVGLSYKFLG